MLFGLSDFELKKNSLALAFFGKEKISILKNTFYKFFSEFKENEHY